MLPKGGCMVTIAINTGFYSTKVKLEKEEFVFESRLSKSDKKDSHFILDNVGYKLEEGNFNVESYKEHNEVQRGCMAYAIARATPMNEVKVITALPMSQYVNRLAREKYKAHLMEGFKIQYKGIERVINIRNPIIFMEGAAAVYNNIDKFKGKLVGLIDWGGKTINAAVFEDCKPIGETILTLDMGILVLEEKIRKAINQKLQRNMQSYQMRYLYNSDDTEERIIIEQVIAEHLQELRQKLILGNWDLKGLNLVGTGGGVLKLNDYLKQIFEGIKINQAAQFENVRGLWNIARALEA